MFGDEPDRFFRAHPLAIIKTRQVHRARVAPQGAFAAQVEVNVKITHGQLAQGAINGFAITAAGEIGFGHRTPMPAYLENRNDVIGVLLRFQIEDQRWESQNAEGSRPENSAFET